MNPSPRPLPGWPITTLAMLASIVAATPPLLADSVGPERWGEIYARALIDSTPEQQANIVREVFAESTLQKAGVERLAGQLARIKADFAPDEFHHSELFVSELGPGSIRRILHVYVRRKGDSVWRDVQMILDPEPPHRIESIAFIAEVTEPVALPNGDIDQSATLDWLNRYVDKLVAENDLAGSILVARGDEVLFERHFGFADAARTLPAGRSTLFNLGSGNKMFTALAVMRLVEAGKLSLDDPLGKFAPDFPAHDGGRAVTLRHLLTHTSGIGEYWRPENVPEMRAAESWRDLLPLIHRTGYDFEPGASASYSNSNFILLGLVLERTTGEDYFDLIQRSVYLPAGMEVSGTFAPGDPSRSLAVPLVRDAASGAWKEAPHGRRGSPAGGGYSNAADMLRFARALVQGRLVSPATLRTMTADANARFADGFAYGLGFEPVRHGRVESFGHGGIAPGINSEFRYFPSLDITLVVFSNQDNGAFDDLRKNTTKLISGQR